MAVRRAVLIVGAIAVAALVAFALFRRPAPHTKPAAAAPTQEPELVPVPRTQLAEAKQRIDSGSVLVIDVRDADSYIASHIPGAIQIPLARVEGEINYLPRTKPILTYCT
jgi:3-mercaptopyruvate sulfurtransferase SseA